MSSQTVYGIPERTLGEALPLRPTGWYDLAKVCNEFQLADAASRSNDPGRRGVAMRLPLFFGSGQRRRDRQFLYEIWDALIAGKEFLFSDEHTAVTA